VKNGLYPSLEGLNGLEVQNVHNPSLEGLNGLK